MLDLYPGEATNELRAVWDNNLEGVVRSVYQKFGCPEAFSVAWLFQSHGVVNST